VFKRHVDLINLEEASTVFKAQVAGKAKVIYFSNNSKRCYFEMRALYVESTN
jgi:uncharacterized protein